MTQPHPPRAQAEGKASDSDMRALLKRYVRYAALVRHQEEALDREDLDRFEDLAQAREVIQEEIRGAPPIPDPDALDPDCREYLERILENFKDTMRLDARLRSRLQKMKKDASMNMKIVEGRGGQARGYLAGEEGHSSGQVHQVNVRS